MKSQEWCVEQLPESNRWRCLRLKGSKGGVCSFSRVTECSDIRSLCKGHIHFCFHPGEYHLLCDEFPKAKADLLEMHIRKRFIDRGLTMDGTNYIHRSGDILGKAGWLSCLFVPKDEVSALYSFIQPLNKIRNLHLVPDAAAVAALLKTITNEAVLVLLLGNQKSQVLVVKGGIPLYSQALSQSSPGVVDEALILHAVDFARVSVRKDFNIEILHISCMGEARGNIKLEELSIEEWKPDFNQVFETKSQGDVLLYPQLFGARYVDHSYNFLPKEFSTSWRLQSFGVITSIFAAVGAVALLGGWLLLQSTLKEQRLRYQDLSTSVSRLQQQITQRVPSTATLDSFLRLANIRNLAIKDSRLNQLVGNLSLALPEKVHITNLTVRRQSIKNVDIAPPPPGSEDPNMPKGIPGAASQNNVIPIPEQLQAQDIVIETTCISNGSYSEITSRFENVVVALNSIFKVQDMNWGYNEENKTGRLSCALSIKDVGDQP